MAISPAAQNSTPLAYIYSQYKDLLSRYVLCRTELQKIFNEAETLRQENVNLLLENRVLMDRVNLLIEATHWSPSQTQQFSDSREQYHSSSSSLSSIGGSFEKERDAGNWSGSFGNERDTGNCSGSFEKERNAGNWSGSFSGKIQTPKTAIEKAQEENRKVDNKEKETVRVNLPKSISVKSAGVIGRTSTLLRSTARNRAPTPVASAPQKVYVRGGSQKNGPTELEVYNQGMFKTELCNKWQDTGSCPYGDHCQFAHGIAELRPVIRHPRYKTEVCRMVLSGEPCPYGHRCHFRHALTDEEKVMLSLKLD